MTGTDTMHIDHHVHDLATIPMYTIWRPLAVDRGCVPPPRETCWRIPADMNGGM